MKISIIAALGKNTRAIGKDNQLLWKIPEDLKRFRTLTTGHVIIMGRKTYESIGRPLPNRTNVIITRNKSFIAESCHITHSLADALALARKLEETEAFIIGGEEIYRQGLLCADVLYLTHVDDDAIGDAYFPEFEKNFHCLQREQGTDKDFPPYEFTLFTRSLSSSSRQAADPVL
jgi:dihydrofolate reductase